MSELIRLTKVSFATFALLQALTLSPVGTGTFGFDNQMTAENLVKREVAGITNSKYDQSRTIFLEPLELFIETPEASVKSRIEFSDQTNNAQFPLMYELFSALFAAAFGSLCGLTLMGSVGVF